MCLDFRTLYIRGSAIIVRPFKGEDDIMLGGVLVA